MPGMRVWPSAAPPSPSTATIANLDRISATSSSTARTAQIRRAGHTIAAKNSGSMSTITYTAACRISSSSHSVIAAAMVNSAMKKDTNGAAARAGDEPPERADAAQEARAPGVA